MTVMVREDLNAADLAWAAADPSTAHLAKEMLQARAALAADRLAARDLNSTVSGPVPPLSAPTGALR